MGSSDRPGSIHTQCTSLLQLEVLNISTQPGVKLKLENVNKVTQQSSNLGIDYVSTFCLSLFMYVLLRSSLKNQPAKIDWRSIVGKRWKSGTIGVRIHAV